MVRLGTAPKMSLIQSWWSLTLTVVAVISAIFLGISVLEMTAVTSKDPGTPEAQDATAKAVEQGFYHALPTWLSFLIDPAGMILLFLLAGLIAGGIMYLRSR